MDRRPTLLVVDDEPLILEQIQELLEANYELTMARSFDEAVAAFDKQTPDAAILDIMGVNGEELLARFRTRAPCIMLTAHSLSPASLKRAAEKGARLYLPKDELVRLPEYVEHLRQHPREALWKWLLGRLDFRRWFGTGWTAMDEKWLFDITSEDIDRDLKYGRD